MRVRRFRFLTPAHRDHLHRVFSAVVGSWHSEWLGPQSPSPASSLFTDFSKFAERTVRVYRGQDGAWVGIALESWAEFSFAAGLFKVETGADFELGVVSSAVVKESLRDLARAAMPSAIVDESEYVDSSVQSALPSDAFQRGSICIGIEFSIGCVQVTMFVGSAAVDQRLQAVEQRSVGAAVEPLHRALGHRPVPVHVELGSAEIRAEDLLSLQAGDVVRIDRRIDQPLDLVIEGEHRLKGFLARGPDGRKCVRLIAAS